jgi:hypothetical protein
MNLQKLHIATREVRVTKHTSNNIKYTKHKSQEKKKVDPCLLNNDQHTKR